MSNWNFVFSYDARAEAWLRKEGFPAPGVQRGNRLPRTSELLGAIGQLGKARAAELLVEGFDWERPEAEPEGAFRMRGSYEAQFELLVTLAKSCGQLWLYQDTGAPAVVVEAQHDPLALAHLCATASEREDGWEYLHQQLYS